MVTIHPFRALRYSPTVISDLSAVISPPYDIINAAKQEQLYEASPHNVIRLILGKEFPDDTPQHNRYVRAQRDFTMWTQRGVLQQDQAPSLYLIAHTFQTGTATHTRLGFIALLAFDEATPQQVFRHEATLAAPKVDRTKLLEAVAANLEPIFCIYPDQEGHLQQILQTATHATPTAQARINAEHVSLWAVTEPALIQRVRQHLAQVSILIADGHHRFEVAYAKRQQYGALMSYFVSMADPALVVRPIHRMILSRPAASIEQLSRLCQIERRSDLHSLTEELQATSRPGQFGYYDGRLLYRLSILPESLQHWLEHPSVAQPLASLDVSILHGLLLPTLGILASEVRYHAEAAMVLSAVDRGEAGSAWLLRGIPLPQVYEIASHGLLLPPKSTYFYPKVPSGLTINPFSSGI